MSTPGRRHVLVLREYDSAVIGDEWDPARRTIPARAAAEIERLQAQSGHEIFHLGRRTITARNFVGTVGIDGQAIDILPKTDTDEAETRANLMRMLGIAGLVPSMDAGVAALAGRAPTMVDAFMRVYVTQLAVEWRRGHIANYRKHDANRMALRGKLLFDGHIRLNRLHPERFYTRADEFLQDVAISRLLKAGLRACRRYSTTDGLRQETTSLLAEFDGVRDQYTVTSDLLDIEVDRRTARFGPLVELAKLLLVGQVPDRSGENSTFSLVFDMNVVFERFIARLLTRVTAGSEPSRRVRRQLTGRSLLIQAGKQRFGLRPDVEVSADGMRLCLLDTKWKRLDPLLPHHGVSQADMYQMFAYGKVYDCPVVILLYPRHGDFAARVATYAHHPGEPGSARIEVCTVDIRQPPARGEQSVYAQLHDLLEETIGGAGHASGAPRSTADGPTTFIHGVHHD